MRSWNPFVILPSHTALLLWFFCFLRRLHFQVLLGLKTCAGFLNCLRGTSEASALLFFFLPFIWDCLHYSPQQNVSISMSSILSTILLFWWLWTRTACTTRALATVYRHITHTHTLGYTYTESLFKWRMRNARTLTSSCHSPSTSTGSGLSWLGLAWLGASKSIWMPRIIMSYQCESDSLACTLSLSRSVALSLFR